MVFGCCLLLSWPAAAQGDPRLSVSGSAGMTFEEQPAPLVAGGIGVRLGRSFHLVGEAGWLSNVLPDSAQAQLDLIAAVASLTTSGSADVDARVRGVYGMAGGRFYFGHGAIAPFVEGGAGVARFTPAITADVDPFDITEELEESLRDQGLSATKPFVAGSAGLAIRVSPHASIDAAYRWLRTVSDVPAITVQGVQAGIRFSF